MMISIGIGGAGLPTPYEKAEEKAKNPGMVLAGNPLVRAYDQRQDPVQVRNLRRLQADVDRRVCPGGHIYEQIMDGVPTPGSK